MLHVLQKHLAALGLVFVLELVRRVLRLIREESREVRQVIDA